MIIRQLLRRPLRLILSLLSLAAALAIVVTAGAWKDMIHYLLENQFQRAQRETLSVNLFQPGPISTLNEIRKLPGVIAAEGYRTLPIRMRFRNFKRELILTGWPREAAMRQLLDKHLQPIPIPPQGLLLSRFFAENWGLKSGDFLEIEPLEGNGKRFSLRVQGFSDDLLGVSANISLDSLWQELGEQSAYNQITIMAEPGKLGALYKSLKGMPKIAAVNMKQALYEGFRDSFGKVMENTNLILEVAALLIAFGIIYNSVRITFSERSRELASLGVLGFQRGEVFRFLLIEVGAPVLLSLLPGCYLGWTLTKLSVKLIRTETYGFPAIIERATYVRGIGAVLVAFALSFLVIYRMVRKLNPAEALKYRE